MKRVTSIVLALVFCLGAAIPAVAYEPRGIRAGLSEKEETVSRRDASKEEELAKSLKALGLFKGVSETDFDLLRAPTRMEALVMLIRLLGEEGAALQSKAPQPFTDVPDWGERYAAYAYEKGYTKGETDTLFGSGHKADVKMYLTFVLRALGYKDGEGEDFEYKNPFTLAKEAGVLPDTVNQSSFFRADVVTVSYAALGAKLKNAKTTLGSTLIKDGAFSEKQFEKLYDSAAIEKGAVEEKIAANVKEAILRMELDSGLELAGLSVAHYGSVIQIGDGGYENYGYYDYGAKKAAEAVNAAATLLEGKARVFDLVGPNSLGVVLSNDAYRGVTKAITEAEGIANTYAYLNELVYPVDACTVLRAHNDEYVYFRTDHHWTALGAYYAYVAWAEAAGFEPVSLSEFDKLEMPGHLGLFYSMCGNPAVMKANPDRVDAYIPRGNITVTHTNKNGSTIDGKLVYDYTNNAYKYGAFIGGDYPLTTIVNNDIKDDSACVIYKDSYGNPFTVYLANHYHTVYAVDYRYYPSTTGRLSLSQFEEKYDIDDVIVLSGMTLSQADSTSANFRKLFQ